MSYVCKTLIRANATAPDSHDKRLSICLRADGFSFSESDAAGRLLTFGFAEGIHPVTMTAALADIKRVFAEADIRPLAYSRMELVVMSDASVWVPDELYLPSSNRSYLRLMGVDATGIVTCQSAELRSTAVFTAREQLVTAFKVALPGVQMVNQHAKMVRLATMDADHPVIFTHWHRRMVDVAAYSDGAYRFGNTMRVESDKDIAFKLIEVMRCHCTDQDRTELLICGEVDRERYARLRPFFPKTTLFTGTMQVGAEFRGLRTYEHALILF